MEGVPLRLLLSILLMATVVALAFYEISVFSGFSTRKQFADDIINFNQAMGTLSATGDYGSFTRVKMGIPEGCNFTVNSTSDTFTAYFFGEVKKYNASGDFIWNRSYGSGTYELQLYYGTPSSAYTPGNSPYLVPFK